MLYALVCQITVSLGTRIFASAPPGYYLHHLIHLSVSRGGGDYVRTSGLVGDRSSNSLMGKSEPRSALGFSFARRRLNFARLGIGNTVCPKWNDVEVFFSDIYKICLEAILRRSHFINSLTIGSMPAMIT